MAGPVAPRTEDPSLPKSLPKKQAFALIYGDDDVEIRGNVEDLALAERVFLSFTGIGHKLGDIEVQKLEFVGSSSRRGVPIFFSDLNRTWGNGLDFEAIAARLAPYLEGREVVAIGNSMGGFLAILATSYLKIDTVIAFAPQFSVHPEVVPGEIRWTNHRAKITTWRYPSLEGHFHKGVRYYVFFGNEGREILHYSRFPVVPNLMCVICPRMRHTVATDLKARGLLDEVIAACVERRFTLANISGAMEKPPFLWRGKRGPASRVVRRVHWALKRLGRRFSR